MTIEKMTVLEAEVVAKLTKEEKEELKSLADSKAVVLHYVNQYYQSQDSRIRSDHQIRMLLEKMDFAEIPSTILKQAKNAAAEEAYNKKCIDVITDTVPICRWMKSITGIGPILSAYIYSSFDIDKANYATEFLSYAGLNDNNNPWLGNDKANKIVKDAIAYRAEKFDIITESLKGLCKDKKTEKSLFTGLKKAGKDIDIDCYIIGDIVYNNTGHELSDIDTDYDFIEEYVLNLAYPSSCDDILIGYIAPRVKRKPSLIKKGTYNNWRLKKSKTKIPYTSDLVAYLAKPPYNTDLKKRMFLVGDMFIKNSGREKSLYGRIYKDRKMTEHYNNDQGLYADQAAKLLEEKNYDKNTPTYKALSQGKLSDAHINSRARRYATKLFISHVFEAMYYEKHGKKAPNPYVISHLDHHDYIAPEVDFVPFIDGDM